MLDARDARGKARSLEAEKPSEIGKDAGFALGVNITTKFAGVGFRR